MTNQLFNSGLDGQKALRAEDLAAPSRIGTLRRQLAPPLQESSVVRRNLIVRLHHIIASRQEAPQEEP
jgi:hypothetical protein